MKNRNIFFASILAIGVLAGCNKSNDNPLPGPGGGSDDAAYMSVEVALPSAKGTRSEAAGSEVGQDYENKVQKLMLVLTRTDNSYVAHGVVESAKQTGSTVTTTAKINRTAIFNFYKDEKKVLTGEEQQIHVFVFCNPTDALIAQMGDLKVGDTKWVDLIGQVEDDQSDIWRKNFFLMGNSEIAVKRIPASYDDWVTLYANETSPFDLSGDNGGSINNTGAIEVERAVARFDFRDGSPVDNGAHTFDIGEGDDKGRLQVRLVRMALVNLNNSFYYLRRVSNDGLDAGSTLCGAEKADNYVVSTANEIKQKELTGETVADLSNWFNYCLYNSEGHIDDQTRKQWDSYWIDDVMAGGEDIDEGWTADQKTGYRIWRYVTENTIPVDNKYQRTGVSTGVVFKGKLLANESLGTDTDLYKAITGNIEPGHFEGYTYEIDGKRYPILYLFQKKLYTGWNREVATAAAADPRSDLYKAAMTAPEGQETPDALYKKLVKIHEANGDVTAALAAFRKAATAAGFTLYQASNDADGITGDNAGVGYYFYYYYWNRHNDNNKPGAMGQMEFGAVRNNVYKLAVTGIRKLGHPRNTDNDPDPVDPNDPDESGDIYLKVSVEVLPWTVRVNNIEF